MNTVLNKEENENEVEAENEQISDNSDSESVSEIESDLDSKEDSLNDQKNENNKTQQDQERYLNQEKEQILNNSNKVCLRNKTRKQRSNELDSVRFSMYNIQNSQINEIDALLSELNQLQTELVLPDSEMNTYRPTYENISPQQIDENIELIDQQFDEVLKFLAQSIDSNNTNSNSTDNISSNSPSSISLSATPNSDLANSDSNKNDLKFTHPSQTKRNSSDSAFMETVSMPSSTSLGIINNNNSNNQNNQNSCSNSSVSDKQSNQSQSETQKAELIRIALEKLKEANIKKLIVKAYTDDGCAKSIIIDETMKIYDVMLMLFSKNHTKPNLNYCIVEYLPKFNMERIFEDHENLVEAMSNWARDSENQIFFTEKLDKYDLFFKPELYLMNEHTLKRIDDFERNRLINEYFQNIGSPVPEIEGPMYLKIESKKSWKKYYCVLRQSGLYYIPKGKSKKDMQCLFNFEKLDLYYGLNWQKEFKAPTDSCFALKYPQVQKKSSKYIKYLCCENQRDMKKWINGIRIAKFGKQLFDNYKKMCDLVELSRVSGRIPIVNNRRLSSSSMPSGHRPRSSYSIGSSSNLDENRDNNNQDQNKTLLIKKDLNTSKTNNNSNNINNNNNQIKANLAYTDQLKSLINSNQLKAQNENFNQVNANSWQNILSPISVTTNLNKSSSCLNTFQSPNNNLNKTVKIPVTTDLTKHLINYQTQRNLEMEAQLIKTNDSCNLNINSNSFSFNYQNNSENVYDLPTPPDDILQSQFLQESLNLNLNVNRNSRSNAPLVAPKPLLKRFNSISDHENINNNRNSEILRKKSFDASNRQSNNHLSRNSNDQNSPELINELSVILARQKKKIEDSENESLAKQRQENLQNTKQPSPTITKKPPPPPRNEHKQMSRKLSIDNTRYLLN